MNFQKGGKFKGFLKEGERVLRSLYEFVLAFYKGANLEIFFVSFEEKIFWLTSCLQIEPPKFSNSKDFECF